MTRRKVIVFFSLAGVLSLTTILLRAMAPSPMTPEAANVLFAAGTADSLDGIFNTHEPVQPDRWQYIFIHQSKTLSGNTLSLSHGPEGLGDHFIVGNGDGCADGELQVGRRWNLQSSAVAPTGANGIDPTCISICVVGDFEKRPPTPIQLGRLGQVVQMLESRLHISPSRVILLNDQGDTSAGLGRYFPTSAFHDQLYTKPVVN